MCAPYMIEVRTYVCISLCLPGRSEREEWTQLAKNHWEHPGFLRCVFIMTAIDECVSFPTVTMEVAEEHQPSLSIQAFYQTFGMINRWVNSLVWGVPSPIQVTSSQRTSVIPINDTIGVEHGDEFEDEVLSQEFS